MLSVKGAKSLSKTKKKTLNKHVISNNLFILKLLFSASPTYAIMTILDVIRHEGNNFIEHTFGVCLILEAVEYQKDFRGIRNFIIFLFIIVLGSAIYSTIYNQYIKLRFRPKITEKLKLMLYEKAKDIDLSCYDDPSYYNEYVLVLGDADNAMNRAEDFLRMITGGISILVMYGSFFIGKDLISIAFVFVAYLCNTIFKSMYSKIKYDLYIKENPIQKKLNYLHRVFYLNEYSKEIRLNREAAKELHKEFDEANEKVVELRKAVGKKRFFYNFMGNYVCNDFLFDVVYILYLIFKAAILHQISYSSVVVLYNSVGNFRRGFGTIKDLIPQAIEASLYIDKIRAFLSYDTKVISEKNLSVPKKQMELELKKVSFAYKEGETILSEISLTLTPGEKVALVGYNGAGKTTLTKLIMRLYDPTEGEILLGGVDIKDYNVKEYRDYIGAVFQDFRIYAATIRDNVVMDNKEEAKEEQVVHSLQLSGFYDKLMKLTEGVETELTREFSENGIDLSGGEEQKLAIARGFYKDSQIMILDEPSSALDPIAEYQLNETMLNTANQKTVLFISHRLSTTRKADKIFMLEKGRIIEQGSHEELLRLNGKYEKMWRAQASKYVD